MIDKDTPAFPTSAEHGFNSGMHGMTLRDYFAAKVLQGMASITGVNFGGRENVALLAYELADEMMEARMK